MRRAIGVTVLAVLCSATASGALVVSEQYRWPAGEIPFAFDANFNDGPFVMGGIGIWHSRLGTDLFRPKRDDDKQWVLFIRETDPEQPPCRVSLVGKPNQDVARVYLRDRADARDPADRCSIDVIVHELGHVIGLHHEHQRCDARVYLALSEGANTTVRLFPWVRAQYEPVQCTDFKFRSAGEYDFFSVMHYPPFADTACLRSPCLPFVLTEQGRRLLQRFGITTLEELHDYRVAHDCALDTSCISDSDLQAVKQMYSLP